jgi:hypothetical protein
VALHGMQNAGDYNRDHQSPENEIHAATVHRRRAAHNPPFGSVRGELVMGNPAGTCLQ